MKEFNSVEEVIEAVRGGKIVVVMDDEDRENEGDVICAAEFATPENVNFMASYAKGLICMPMHVDYVEKLGLDMMCSVNTDNHGTAFTESIDYKDTTTGISAFERSMTAMKVVEDGAKPEETAVETFDNGTATVNTETCEALGLDLETIKKDFEPLCTQVNEITTAESFDDVEAK